LAEGIFPLWKISQGVRGAERSSYTRGDRDRKGDRTKTEWRVGKDVVDEKAPLVVVDSKVDNSK
jgi:hypothetical protein